MVAVVVCASLSLTVSPDTHRCAPCCVDLVQNGYDCLHNKIYNLYVCTTVRAKTYEKYTLYTFRKSLENPSLLPQHGEVSPESLTDSSAACLIECMLHHCCVLGRRQVAGLWFLLSRQPYKLPWARLNTARSRNVNYIYQDSPELCGIVSLPKQWNRVQDT